MFPRLLTWVINAHNSSTLNWISSSSIARERVNGIVIVLDSDREKTLIVGKLDRAYENVWKHSVSIAGKILQLFSARYSCQSNDCRIDVRGQRSNLTWGGEELGYLNTYKRLRFLWSGIPRVPEPIWIWWDGWVPKTEVTLQESFLLSAPAFPLIPLPVPFLRISFPSEQHLERHMWPIRHKKTHSVQRTRSGLWKPPAQRNTERLREGRKSRLAEDQSDLKEKSLPSSWEDSLLAVLGNLCIDNLLQRKRPQPLPWAVWNVFKSRGSNEQGLSGLASFSI